jgi:streptomycin 6-kinase
VIALRDDESAGAEMKALGYARLLRIETTAGTVVFRTLRPDEFGHDRRADRVESLVLAYDTFGKIPHHVGAVDVGMIRNDGALVPLADTGEPYLITTWTEGTLYADDLRRVADGMATDEDLARAEALARVLLEIHAQPGTHPGAYTRAIRDLLGLGESIFGMVDSYDADTVAPARLQAIEEACLAWRWKLRGQNHRLRRTHGDFHPFNIVFGERGVSLLDASRGVEGDPADDVAALSINYLFFATKQTDWRSGLGALWSRFWSVYLAGDRVDVCAAIAPFFAWRALVIASPKWYPHMSAADRDRILRFAERALAADRFDPTFGLEAMSGG